MTLTIDLAVREFLLACRADGLSPATVRTYRGVLTPLAARLHDRTLDAISVRDMREHIIALRERTTRYRNSGRGDNKHMTEIPGGLSAESIRKHIRTLRRFFKWCCIEYKLARRDNPMRGIRMPGRTQREPKAVSLDTLQALLAVCDEADVMGLRDKTMICFLCDTGCRASGMLTLKVEDLQLAEGYAVVEEKGRKRRMVPFSPLTGKLLYEWLARRPVVSEFVFTSLSRQFNGTPMTVYGLNIMLKRRKKQAGITGRVNPHSFRHGFARQYLMNGGDLATLRQILGHSDVSVTAMHYAIFQDLELRKAHEKFSPLRNLTNADRD
jgi:site-specific recombinase XerD